MIFVTAVLTVMFSNHYFVVVVVVVVVVELKWNANGRAVLYEKRQQLHWWIAFELTGKRAKATHIAVKSETGIGWESRPHSSALWPIFLIQDLMFSKRMEKTTWTS